METSQRPTVQPVCLCAYLSVSRPVCLPETQRRRSLPTKASQSPTPPLPVSFIIEFQSPVFSFFLNASK